MLKLLCNTVLFNQLSLLINVKMLVMQKQTSTELQKEMQSLKLKKVEVVG